MSRPRHICRQSGSRKSSNQGAQNIQQPHSECCQLNWAEDKSWMRYETIVMFFFSSRYLYFFMINSSKLPYSINSSKHPYSINSSMLLFQDYSSARIALSRFITNDLVCILVPKAPKVSPLKTVLMSFDWSVWAGVVVTFTTLVAMFYGWHYWARQRVFPWKPRE